MSRINGRPMAIRLNQQLPIVPFKNQSEYSMLIAHWRLKSIMTGNPRCRKQRRLLSLLQFFVDGNLSALGSGEMIIKELQRRTVIVHDNKVLNMRRKGKNRFPKKVTYRNSSKLSVLFNTEWPESFKCYDRKKDESDHVAMFEFSSKVGRAQTVVDGIFREDCLLQVGDAKMSEFFIADLSFVPSYFFTIDDRDPVMVAGKHYCVRGDGLKKKIKVPKIEPSLQNQISQDVCLQIEHHRLRMEELVRELVPKKSENGDILGKGREMENGKMRIFPFKENSEMLRLARTDLDANSDFFWRMVNLLILGHEPKERADGVESRPMSHTSTLLYTKPKVSSGENCVQKPHYDYSWTELMAQDGESNYPWGVDMSLSSGGFCLNVWHRPVFDDKYLFQKRKAEQPKLPESNAAIHLIIPSKHVFFMRGDCIHAGALNNKVNNGALRLHMYLSPFAQHDEPRRNASRRNNTAVNKWVANQVWRELPGEITSRRIYEYLSDCSGNRF